ncbi:MAG: DUF1499 domain-containing protein [Hyphomicrobiales bacterium]|nr:DUF1499 domain-containing protein [Hyphomicrobiales bacterium]
MRRQIVEEPMSVSAVWSLRLSVFALAVAAVAALVIRFRIVDAPAGLAVFGSAILLACVALLLALSAAVVIWRTGRRGLSSAIGGAALALALLAWPGFLAAQAIRLPVLNDVTTDIADPPQFSLSRVATEARAGHTPTNPSALQREQQRAAYPGVQAILLELEADEAYQVVLKAVQASGWKIIDQSPPGGRGGLGHVDAVARTFVMGFPDDITIRIKPLAGQTKIDVRSVSRYGRNDFGVNARRIEQFAQEIQNQINTK